MPTQTTSSPTPAPALEALREQVLADKPTPAPVTSPVPEAKGQQIRLVESTGLVEFDARTADKLISNAYSVQCRTEREFLLPGEEKSKRGQKGVSIRRLDAYDWNRMEESLSIEHVKSAKRALRIVLAAEALARSLKA